MNTAIGGNGARLDVPLLREPTMAELFGDLARDTGTLVRHEVQLAAVEMADKAKQAARSASMVGVGGVLLHSSLVAFMVAAFFALSLVLPHWAAALIVGAAGAAAGIAFYLIGTRSLAQLDLAPRRTLQTLKEDGAWAKQQIR